MSTGYFTPRTEERVTNYYDLVYCSEHVSSACWIWNKSVNEKGYAQLWCKPFGKGKSRNHRGHRAFYMHYRGEIADDMQLDHTCQNESCVNPWHMEQVDNAENCYRKWQVINAALVAKTKRS